MTAIDLFAGARMTEHTKGRLERHEPSDGQIGLYCKGWGYVCFIPHCGPLPIHKLTQETNARRLVACWNACEGISDPEKYIEYARQLNQDMPKMLAHDEMLAYDKRELIGALRRVVEASDRFVVDTGMKHGDLLTDAVDAARSTLAKHAPKGPA